MNPFKWFRRRRMGAELFEAAYEVVLYWKERKGVTPEALDKLQKKMEDCLAEGAKAKLERNSQIYR